MPSPTRPPNDPSRRSSRAPDRRCPRAASTMPNWRRWSTHPTNGSSSAPASAAATSPARRNHRHARDRGRAQARSTPPGSTPADIGLIVLATATPDQTFPVVGDQGPGRARHQRLHRVRRPCRLHRLPLRADRRRFDAPRRQRAPRAGDRRRDLQPHPRLGRPHHLRPVRRRRRRAGAGGRGRRIAASSRPSSTPTAATTTCCSSTAAPRPPARSASCA